MSNFKPRGEVLCHATYAFAVNCDIRFCRGSCTEYHRSVVLDLTRFMEDDLMPAPIPVPVRHTILQRWQKGDSVAKLAEDLQLSERTVRHLVQRFAQRGAEALDPDYARCGTKKLPIESDAYQKAVELRQQHPKWGGGLIRVMLQEADQPCPSVRTLQR